MWSCVCVVLLPTVAAAAGRLRGSASDEVSGSYSGTATVLGETFTGHVVFDESSSSSTLELSLEGPVSLDCVEAYHLEGSEIVLDTLDDPDDCVGSVLAEYGVTIESITYAPDEIDLSLQYGIFPIDLTMTRDALRLSTLAYVGKNDDGLEGTLVVRSPSSLDLSVEMPGVFSVRCDDLPYTVAPDEISVDTIDCLHDALHGTIKLKKVTYDFAAAARKITVVVDFDGLDVGLLLYHSRERLSF